MSGEGAINDGLGASGSPLAVALDTPRVLYPLRKQLEQWFGPGVAGSVDATAHQHMMDAFYYAPRVSMELVSDDSVVSRLLPESDNWTWMKIFQNDARNVHAIPIAGDPAIRGRVKKALEGFRRPKVKSLIHDDVVQSTLDQLIIFYDDAGHAIAGAAAIPEEGEERKLLTVVPLEEALRKARVSVLRKRKERDFSQLFSNAESLLGPGSEFAQATGHDATIERFLTHETAFKTLELLDKFHDDPKSLKHIYTICSSPATEGFVSFCESAGDLAHVASLVKKEPPWLIKLAQAYSTLGHDTITAGDPEKFLWEKPLEQHVFQLGHDLIGNALTHHDDPDFREDFFEASMAALHDMLNMLHGLDLPARIPKEKDLHGSLTDHTLQRARDMVAMTVIIPYTEELMRLRLGNLQPGEMEQATQYFYSVVGPSTLTTSASRVTGDTERQAAVIEDIFVQLVAQGRWKIGDVFVDLGSSNRVRIGKRHAAFLRKLAAPSKIIAVDAIAHEYPDEPDVLAVQMALEDPDLPMIHARHLGKQEIVPVDAAMMMWSVLNDIGPDKLQDVFNNIAKMLRKREGDKPGATLIVEVPMGYVDDLIKKADAQGQAAFPAANLRYPVGDGGTVDKPLSIVHAYEMLVRAMRAGLEPLNLPPGEGPLKVVCLYDTQAGKKRAFFVFERVGDPQPTLDQLVAVGKAEKVGVGRPDRPA